MMGRIIRLRGDDHHEAQMHLPWYATGQLDPLEHARIDAHVKVCAECQADLKFDRWLGVEVAELPMGVEHGWANLQARLAGSARKPRTVREPIGRRLRAPRGEVWAGWAMAAQFALIVLLAAALVLPHLHAPRYRVLGATGTPGAGNIVMMFRPQTSEAAFRRVLSDGGARLVDGPTPAGAYVLQVPDATRTTQLARFRKAPEVQLAEPIDPARAP